MKKLLCLVLFAVCAVGLSAAEVALVREGKPVAEIILSGKPTRSAQMAAFELQHVIGLITGAQLGITNTPHTGMLPVYLGPADGENFEGEQYKFSVKREAIRLAGHDSQDFAIVDYQNPRTWPGTGYNYHTPRQAYNFHSTLLAVYDFLENLCGVRFYSFGDDGTVYTPRKDLIVKICEKSYEPKCQAFRFAGTAYRDSVRVTTESERKLLELRWRMNTLYGQVNHTTDSLIWRYWGPARGFEKVFIEKRPEYFIRGYEKMPTGDSVTLYSADNPPPAQVCTSHPDVAKYFASEAQAVHEGGAFKNPPLEGVRLRLIKPMEGMPFFYPVQEGDNSYFCKCPQCLQLFSQVKDDSRHAYVHFDFINRVSREAKKLNPELNIATLAYNKCLAWPDPEILTLDAGIMVQICLGVHSWMHPQIYNRQRSIYKQWIKNEKKNRPLTVWTYILSPDDEARRSYNYRNFPVLFPWRAGKIYKEFMNDGIQGVFLELCTKVNLLEGYVAMRLAFDPAQNPNKIIDEYFRLYYGEAAVPMKEFYREVEKITWDPKNYPAEEIDAYMKRWGWGSTAMGMHTQKVNWALGTHERMAKLQQIVNRINASAKTPIVKKRVDIFLKDIWDRAVQGRKEYDQRLLVEKDPPPCYAAAYFPEGINDPASVDWSKIRPTGAWSDLISRKSVSSDSPQVKMAFTDEQFVIRYEEKGSLAMQNIQEDLWSNGIEIFLGNNTEYPFNHYAVGANGKSAGYRHILRDGARVLEPLDMSNIRIVENQAESDTWSFIMVIPRRIEPLEHTGIKRINIIRNTPAKQPLAWSYLSPSDYAASLFRMGYVQLAENATAEEFQVSSDFAKGKNGRDNWMQNTPDAATAPVVKIANGQATLSCAHSYVHYMTLISPLIRFGDKVVFEFTASGKGKGGIGLYFYSAYGINATRWHGSDIQYFEAAETPAKYRMVIDTEKLDQKYRDIVRCRPFLVSEAGATVTFSEVKFTPVPYNGNTNP